MQSEAIKEKKEIGKQLCRISRNPRQMINNVTWRPCNDLREITKALAMRLLLLNELFWTGELFLADDSAKKFYR